ncbi:hypothetical protein Q5752_007107 [Cryptotrichosporon argae]
MSTLETGTPAAEHKPDVEMHEHHGELDKNEIAHLALQEAHNETALDALRNHKWAVAWVVWAIFNCIAVSFDSQAGAAVLSIPQFRQDYGFLDSTGEYELYAKWQSAYSGGPSAGQVIGTIIGGTLGDRIGRKWNLLMCYVLLMIGVTIEVVSNLATANNAVFFVGKVINGVALGVLVTTVMTYIGEIAPLALRGILTAAAAAAFTLGPLVQSLITNSYGSLANSWSYKSIFVAQYGVTGLAALFWPFMPESPTWLLSKGRVQQAERSLRKLGETGDELVKRVADIQLTLEEARQETDGASWAECFRKSNRRRTIIAVAPLTIQSFMGIYWVAGYATYYYELAGFDTSGAFKLAIIQQVVSLLGNATAWFLIDRIGRRGLSLWGLVVLTGLLFACGGAAVPGTVAGNKAASGLIILYCYLYNVTIGATAYVAMSEVATGRLRQKTAALAYMTQGCFGTMWSFVLPYLFNPSEANLQAKVAFVFGGFSVLCCVYFYYYHPETKNRSYEELDEMFRKGVPAREFSSYVTEAESAAQQVAEEVAGGKKQY